MICNEAGLRNARFVMARGGCLMSRRIFTFAWLTLIVFIVGYSETASNTAHAQAGAYSLRPNDQLRIRVYNEPELSGDYQVDGGGFVSVPLAGQVKAAGLTTGQLERAITSKLVKGLIRDPRVAVQILNYGPFYVHGEVKRAGEYPYRPGQTVMDAIASAGGFSYRANENKVYVRRAGTNIEDAYPADVSIPIYPGDNIRVPERLF
jgi:polysaccharide export outer membrane protein